jgi:hypothetical protein
VSFFFAAIFKLTKLNCGQAYMKYNQLHTIDRQVLRAMAVLGHR